MLRKPSRATATPEYGFTVLQCGRSSYAAETAETEASTRTGTGLE
jgi:hypothetical protein